MNVKGCVISRICGNLSKLCGVFTVMWRNYKKKLAVTMVTVAIENLGHRQHVYRLKRDFLPSDFRRLNCNYLNEDLRSVPINLL